MLSKRSSLVMLLFVSAGAAALLGCPSEDVRDPQSPPPGAPQVIPTIRIPTILGGSGLPVPCTGVARAEVRVGVYTWWWEVEFGPDRYPPKQVGDPGNPQWACDVTFPPSTELTSTVGETAMVEIDLGSGVVARCEVNIRPGLNRVNFTRGKPGCAVGLGQFP